MNLIISRITAGLCCLALVSCTSMQTHVTSQPGKNSAVADFEGILAGADSVKIETKDGNTVHARVAALSPSMLEVRTDNSAEVRRIPLSEITKIERNAFDPVKTAILVAAVSLGILGYAFANGAALFAVL